MNFFKDPRTNWKYILIVVILAAITSGSILWFTTKQEIRFVQSPEIIPSPKSVKYLTGDCYSRNSSFGQLHCLSDLAKATKNETICGDDLFLFDEDLRAYCYSGVAIAKKDKTLCEKAGGGQGEQCRAKVAELTVLYSEEEAKKIIENKANEIILAIKNKDAKNLSNFVHPDKGVFFSQYGGAHGLVFSTTQILNFFQDKKVYTWGSYDGSGFPINLTTVEYYNKFIYDVDFANAEEISYNRIIGRGNTVNNIFAVYPNAIVVEYHFSGFDPKYGGMDWRSLRLIFEEKDKVWHLIGISNDQWTI